MVGQGSPYPSTTSTNLVQSSLDAKERVGKVRKEALEINTTQGTKGKYFKTW
jgi:hypothetical protein